MNLGLSKCTAVITGGSSGIGLATARILLDEGARIAICARNKSRLEEVSEDLHAAYGDRVLAWQCDVTDSQSVDEFAKVVAEKFGDIDVLINNAGQGRVSKFEDTTDSQWREELELKFFSIIYPTRSFLPYLKRSHSGCIVCVSSLLGLQPEPHMVATSAARGGQLNLIKSMAVEFAPVRVRVNSVLIGVIDSGQWQRRYENQAPAEMSREEWLEEEARKRYIPLARFGRPEEAAKAIVFLASPASSYITGTSIEVSGGTSRHV